MLLWVLQATEEAHEGTVHFWRCYLRAKLDQYFHTDEISRWIRFHVPLSLAQNNHVFVHGARRVLTRSKVGAFCRFYFKTSYDSCFNYFSFCNGTVRRRSHRRLRHLLRWRRKTSSYFSCVVLHDSFHRFGLLMVCYSWMLLFLCLLLLCDNNWTRRINVWTESLWWNFTNLKCCTTSLIIAKCCDN